MSELVECRDIGNGRVVCMSKPNARNALNMALLKALMDDASTRPLADQLIEEQEAKAICCKVDDHKESLAAAVERREPVFKSN
jgi:hypothetical protein